MDLPVLLAVTAGVIALCVTLLWLLSLKLADASIVDIFWGLGFVLVSWLCLLTGWPPASRGWLLAVLTTLWGLRLAGYLAWRNLGKGEDYRYRAMRERFGASFWWVSLPVVFLLQGLVMWIVSLPLQLGGRAEAGLSWLDAAGAALWLSGLAFESLGDWQLARFKSRPENRGRVLDQGLWRYTRHPNYFGDFLVWWGLFLVAWSGGSPWWTVVSPLLMSWLLMRVSGVRLLESTLRTSKPGYAEYMRRTSPFFPWPPRP